MISPPVNEPMLKPKVASSLWPSPEARKGTRMRTKLLFGASSQRSDPFCSTVRIVASRDGCVESNPSRVEGRKPDRLRHLAPAQVLLSLQSAKIGSGHGQRAVIEKAGNILNALAGVSSQLGRAMPQDVQAGRGKISLGQIPPKATVKRCASKSLPAGGGRRGSQRFMR